MSLRPFRDLCPEADLRDAMSDGEFWEHVFGTEGFGPEDDQPVELDEPTIAPCEVCGSTTACGYDLEGRPMIHATEEET